MKKDEVCRLEINQITLDNSIGTAIARISQPTSLAATARLILHADFIVSTSKVVIPGLEFCCHIPGTMLPTPLFAHVSITNQQVEGALDLSSALNWPPQIECHETFALGIAHMLTFTTLVVQRFDLKQEKGDQKYIALQSYDFRSMATLTLEFKLCVPNGFTNSRI